MAKNKKRKIAVFDFETDPFLYNRTPEPFACGFYDGEIYKDFWGDNCVNEFVAFVLALPDKYYLYAHNGGKFDFIYFIRNRTICNPVKIINSRIVSAGLGQHILRDSYAILPIPLKAHDKGEIDYVLFERENREENKADILEYMARDCESLFTLVSSFVARFGVNLTIGGTAIKEVQKFHPFEKQPEAHDIAFRSYYFGGRVECFKTGKISGAYKVYDVNSMYPFVMADRSHPTGSEYFTLESTQIKFDKNNDIAGFPGKPYFIKFTGTQNGAIPVRTKLGLNFNCADSDDAPDGVFNTMSHEFKIAKKYRLINIRNIVSVTLPAEVINFAEFVNVNIAEKIAGKKTGDKPREIFAKLLMNSSYGKFGQNPDNFKDYFFRYDGEDYPQGEWDLNTDFDDIELWERPSFGKSYYDVATACSVTSAARAVLLEAMQTATGVIYCDTDALICKSLDAKIDQHALGAWDLEKEIDCAYIAGKKLYALYKNGECVKLASKGVRLSGGDIIKLCDGAVFDYQRDAPNFKLTGEAKFLHRAVKMLDKNKNVSDNSCALISTQ